MKMIGAWWFFWIGDFSLQRHWPYLAGAVVVYCIWSAWRKHKREKEEEINRVLNKTENKEE